jgi:uncharacterized protein YjiS (DUF1127 family)
MTALSPRHTADSFAETRLSRAAGAGYARETPAYRPQPLGALGRGLAAIAAGIRAYVHRQQVMSELSRLTDRELADIGLSRTDIGQVFTSEFSAQRRAARGA